MKSDRIKTVIALFFYLIATYAAYTILSIWVKAPVRSIALIEALGYIIVVWLVTSSITAGLLTLANLSEIDDKLVLMIFVILLLLNLGMGVIPIVVILSSVDFERVIISLLITATPTSIIAYQVILGIKKMMY